jgi:hypothetical protein
LHHNYSAETCGYIGRGVFGDGRFFREKNIASGILNMLGVKIKNPNFLGFSFNDLFGTPCSFC